MGERGTELLQVILEKRWEASLMLPGELWVLLGEGDSAGSLAATQLLLALVEGQEAVTMEPGFEI